MKALLAASTSAPELTANKADPQPLRFASPVLLDRIDSTLAFISLILSTMSQLYLPSLLPSPRVSRKAAKSAKIRGHRQCRFTLHLCASA